MVPDVIGSLGSPCRYLPHNRLPGPCSLVQVIDKVRRAAVVDGDEVSSSEDAFTVAAFLEALKEEAALSAGECTSVEREGTCDAARLRLGMARNGAQSN